MAGITIQVLSNAHGVRLDMRHIALTQLPFAGSKALNATAKDATEVSREALGKKFTVRSRAGNRGIRTQFMTKKDWPKRGPEIQWRDYLAQHNKGGRVRPTGGARAFAIPTRFVVSRRTKSGKIRKSFKPGPAISAGKAQVEERERRGVIAKKAKARKGKAGARLRIWFQLRRSINLRPVLKARATVEPVVAQKYPKHFRFWMARALNTRRKIPALERELLRARPSR